MPSEKKLIDKFTLINVFGTMMNALENDMIDIGKISFSKTGSGAFNCTVAYHEVEYERKDKTNLVNS